MLRSNNNKRRKVNYQKWNHSKFEFSPHKIKKVRQSSWKALSKDLWKERWKLSAINTGIAQNGGTYLVFDKGKFNHLYYANYEFRKINRKKRRKITITGPLSNKGTIRKQKQILILLNSLEVGYIHRMDKRKREEVENSSQKESQYVEEDEMDTGNEEEQISNPNSSLDIFQDDKYWEMVHQMTKQISLLETEYIPVDRIVEYLSKPGEIVADTTTINADISRQRANQTKQTAIVDRLERFLKEACDAGTNEMVETYDVIGHAVRITYELTNARITRSIKEDYAECKRVWRNLTGSTEEDTPYMDIGYEECLQHNLQRIAGHYNMLRTTLLTGVAHERAIQTLGILSESHGGELLEQKIADHAAAVAKEQKPVVERIQETKYEITDGPPKLPPRKSKAAMKEVQKSTENRMSLETAIGTRDAQRGKQHVNILETEWPDEDNDPEIITRRRALIEYLTTADDWIDTAQYIYVIGLNLANTKKDSKEETAYTRVLREVTNAFQKVGHSPYIGKEEVKERTSWEVDTEWLSNHFTQLQANSFRSGFSNGIPIKLKNPIAVAAVGSFNTWKTDKSGKRTKIGRQSGYHVYDLLHMIRSDTELTSKQYTREYWLMAIPDKAQWDQLWNRSAPLWILTGLHSAPEDKYVLAAEIICARYRTIAELKAKGMMVTEENVVAILEQYWTEWDSSTSPPTFIPKNRKTQKGNFSRKPMFIIRMVYVNKSISGGANKCPKYQQLIANARLDREFVAYGFRMERFRDVADMETTPVPMADTLTAHQTICLNIKEGIRAKDILEELLVDPTQRNWEALQAAGQIIVCPGIQMIYKKVAPSIRIVWIRTKVEDVTEGESTMTSEKDYWNIELDPIVTKYSLGKGLKVTMIEEVSDTRREFHEMAERFLNNSKQVKTPSRKGEESPMRTHKKSKKGNTPTKTPIGQELVSVTSDSISTISTTRSTDTQLTKYSDESLSQIFAKLLDMDEKVAKLADKQKEQELEIKEARKEAVAIRDDTHSMQLQSVLREIALLADDVDNLKSRMQEEERAVNEMNSGPKSDLMQLQVMQLSMSIRQCRTEIGTKCNRLRSLREEASRLAVRTTPPTVLEGRQLRDDL